MDKHVMVAILNWGMGHATRSVPIIDCLINTGAKIVLASNGAALRYLKMHYPHITALELPDKEIKYHRKGAAIGLLTRAFQQKRINARQRKWIVQMVNEWSITHIIADNLYGCYHPHLPCAIITHQIGVLSPFFKSRFDRQIASWLRQFDEVWIPDIAGDRSLSGNMLRNKFFQAAPKFIGHISRFQALRTTAKDIDLLAMLSGPEPQRTFLENRLMKIMHQLPGKKVLIRGRPGEVSQSKSRGVRIYDFLDGQQLENSIRSAKLVVCRSGYSSLLDLVNLGAKAILVPTPQQPEQTYLAKRMTDKGWFKSVAQKNLNLSSFEWPIEEKPPAAAINSDTLQQVLSQFLHSTRKPSSF